MTYVVVDYVEEKKGFIQQVVICCTHPSPAKVCVHSYYTELLERAHTYFGPVLSCVGNHMDVLGCYICMDHYTEVIWALIYMSEPVY